MVMNTERERQSVYKGIETVNNITVKLSAQQSKPVSNTASMKRAVGK